MTLDLTTLLAVSGAVVVLTAGLFVGEAWARRGMLVDRVWSLAFIAVITTAMCSLIVNLEPALWWAEAVADGTTVLAVWAVWSGVRAYDHQRPLVELSGGLAILTIVAGLADGPDRALGLGNAALFAGVSAGGLMAGTAVLRGGLRAFRSALTLAVTTLLAGVYYLARLIGYLTVGPDSWFFETFLGTELSTVVLVLMVVAAAFSMVALRSAQAAEGRMLTHTFDAVTGARTAASFRSVATERLRSAPCGSSMCLVAIRPEGIDAIGIAFGTRYAEQALETCGVTARELMAPRDVLGVDARATGFEALLTSMTVAEAREWASRVRKELIGASLAVPGSRLRLTMSVGIAGTDQCGFDLSVLREAAVGAVNEALDAGGNRVVVAGAGARKGRGVLSEPA